MSKADNPKATDLGSGILVEDKKLSTEQNCLAVIGSNLLSRTDLLQQALGSLKQDGFLLLRECPNATLPLDGFNVLLDRIVDGERILLVRKIPKVRKKIYLQSLSFHRVFILTYKTYKLYIHPMFCKKIYKSMCKLYFRFMSYEIVEILYFLR